MVQLDYERIEAMAPRSTALDIRQRTKASVILERVAGAFLISEPVRLLRRSLARRGRSWQTCREVDKGVPSPAREGDAFCVFEAVQPGRSITGLTNRRGEI